MGLFVFFPFDFELFRLFLKRFVFVVFGFVDSFFFIRAFRPFSYCSSKVKESALRRVEGANQFGLVAPLSSVKSLKLMEHPPCFDKCFTDLLNIQTKQSICQWNNVEERFTYQK